jgi:hypothetical protein
MKGVTMNTYIHEEFILQNIVLITFAILFIVALISELICNQKKIDEFSKFKMKKIFKFAYFNLFNQDKEETIKYMKEIYRKDLINEKYDLIKGA